tara:strand:- start:2832 stop:2942 length:111 start_codon:yes stop_codon:yes gene_type:complete
VVDDVSVTASDEDAETVAEKLESPYVLSVIEAKVIV